MDDLRFDRATKMLSGWIGSRRAALATATGALAAAPPAAAKRRKKKRKPLLKVAYTCAGPGDGEENTDPQERFGQVFAATRSGSLRQVRLAIGMGVGSVPGTFIVQLLKTSGAPAIPDPGPRAVLAAVAIPEAEVPEPVGTVVANFGGTPLVVGTEYAIVVSRPESDRFRVRCHTDPAACPGSAAGDSGRDLFSLFDRLDLVVTVLVS